MTKSRDLGNLAQTVAVNLPTSLGTVGQTLVVNSGGTALEFGAAAGGSMTVYNDLNGTDGTPSGYTYLTNASSPSNGDLAFVTANNTVYVRAASGWRKIATVQEAPSTVTGHSASYPDIGQNATTDITLSTTDPEGFDVTWSYAVGGNGTLSGSNINNSNGDTLASIAVQTANSNSGGTNTITYRLTRETTTVAGDFTITFTATDSQSTGTSDTGAISFELAFVIADSHYTTLLMATDGSAGDNNDITDSSSNAYTITANGDAHAGTFSPYRHGGYSAYFDGNDYLSIAHSTDLDLGTGDFTIEGWWRFDDTSNQNLVSKYAANAGFVVQYQSGNLRLVLGLGASDAVYSFSWTPVAGTWYHVCILRDGTNGKAFINGTQIGSTTTVTTSNVGTTGTLQIGLTHTVSEYTRGYVSDVRIVKGTAITPASGGPTERLTSVTNTKLLTCHLPYIADGSSSAHSITVNGNTSTKPIGPYDYSDEYSESTNGGSVVLDGNDNYTVSNGLHLGTGDFTFEFWIYMNEDPTNAVKTFINGETSGTGIGWRFTQDTYAGYNGLTFGYGVYGSYTVGKYVNNYWLPQSEWTHIVAQRRNGTIEIYVNGISKTLTTYNENGTFSDGATLTSTQTSRTFFSNVNGYVSDLKLVTGSYVYDGNFTPPTAPQSSTGSTLHVKGTDAHVIDKSQGNNLKLVGTAASTSALTSGSTPPYIGAAWANTSAVSFDGDSDYVQLPVGSLDLGSSDFTIEAWIYQDTNAGSGGSSHNIYADWQNTNNNKSIIFWITDSSGQKVQFLYSTDGSANNIYTSTATISNSTWTHVAVCKDSTSLRFYKNGAREVWVSSPSFTLNSNSGAVGPIIGATFEAQGGNYYQTYFDGYIQDLRVTKGKARYTAADESSNIPSAPLKG